MISNHPNSTRLGVEQLEPRDMFDAKNVVLIVMDDMRFDLMDWMPRTQRIFLEAGKEFIHSFVTTPSCCPSRASIFTGEYASAHHVFTNGDGGSFDDTDTIATWLDVAGYQTAFFGKYLNGYSGDFIPPGWDDWHAFKGESIRAHGGYYNYKINDNGFLRSYGDDPSDYSTDVLTRKTVKFIEGKLNGVDPFFISYFPRAPHGPSIPAPRHVDFPVNLGNRRPSYNEGNVDDKPRWVRNIDRWDSVKQDQMDNLFRRQIRTLRAVDEGIRDIYDSVVGKGLINDTVFIFTSDNGYLWGEHRLKGKFYPYEESIRVPLLIRDGIPGLTTINDRFALNIDVAPTILGYAGLPIDIHPGIEGKSLVNPPQRPYFFIENFGEGGVPPYTAMHTITSIYISYDNGVNEFYDLINDPFQMMSKNSLEMDGLIEGHKARIR